MTRTLIAALACRAGGSRLYGKPLQPLDPHTGVTILDHMIANLKACAPIDEIVLGIADGRENQAFVDVAERWGLRSIWGDRTDVLQRLVECGRAASATDVFRVTTECPFIETRPLEDAWRRHVAHENDATVTDGLPEGTHLEIFRLRALELSHAKGDASERSERCALYIRRHPSEFRVEILDVPEAWRRLDLRLTVDYPEDLVVCRAVYAALRHHAPKIPLEAIIEFLDGRPDLQRLVAPYVTRKPIWALPPEPAGAVR